MKKLIFTACLVVCSFRMGAQVPDLSNPEAATLGIYGSGSREEEVSVVRPVIGIPGIHDPFGQRRRNEANRQIIDEARFYQAELERRMRTAHDLIRNGFPSWEGEPGTEFYYQAYSEINAMLRDSLPLNLERTVFVVENAFLGNTMKFGDFQKEIAERVQYCRWRMQELRLNPKDGLAANMAIYSLLTDTLQLKQPGTERKITHYPLRYNLDDFDSKKSFTSHFITTLLATNTGQCYSMPMLYLILAERLGADAHLALAPRHSFIKIQDDKGAWYNLELTCGSVLSDYHYMNSSYIKSEAIRNKLYLNPLSKKETIASMLVNLGRYYLLQYGYDPFILKCTSLAKQYAPGNIEARILESAYETRLTLEIAGLLDAPNPKILKEKSAGGYKHYERMQELYKELDESGYEETPPEVYGRWLQHIAREKEKEQAAPQPKTRKIIK